MTLQEMQEELTQKGIAFAPDSSPETLLELLKTKPAELDEDELDEPVPMEGLTIPPQAEPAQPQKSEEEIKRIVDELNKPTMTTEDLTKGIRTPDGVLKESGILIPTQVLTEMQNTKWIYSAEESTDKSVVTRLASGRREFVRAYELGLHGERFKELAKQFVKKKNMDFLR